MLHIFWELILAGLMAHATSTAPPGSGALTNTELRASPVPVSASIDTTGLALDATLSSMSSKLPSALGQKTMANSMACVLPSDQSAISVTASGSVTANAGTNLNTSALALDATLTGGTQRSKITDGTSNAAVKAASTAALATDPALVVTVSPNNSVAVTGPLTDAQLRATPVPVSGTVTASGPLTDTQLRNSAVPVSGPITDTQIRATPLPVSGTVSANATLAAETTKVIGTVNVASSQSITANAGTNLNTSALALDATLTGGTQRTKVTDGTTNAAVKAASTAALAADPALVVAISPNNTVPVSGPITDTQIRATPLPVSGTVAANATLSAETTKVIGTINIASSQAVTANAGTNLNTSALALDATLTGGTARAKITDGTNNAAVKAASTAAAATDPALVVSVSPNSTAPVNQTQINGVTLLSGNGTTGTGSPRVTIASDNTAFGIKIDQTTTNNDVDVTSVIPGVAATSLGKAEDAGSVTGDTGVATLAVRKDTNSQLTNADADYTNLAADAYGAQYVRLDHPNRIRCTVTTSTATVITAVGTSCAAPGAGLSIYITDIEFSASAAGIAADAFPTLKYGTGGTCGTGTTVFWGALTAAAIRAEKHYVTPIKIPANNEVCWITSTAGSKFIVITGYIAP